MSRPSKTSDLLSALILKYAAAPDGFAMTQVAGEFSKNAHKVCGRLVTAGLIFKAKVSQYLIRFFSTPEAAKAFVIQHGGAELTRRLPRQPQPSNPVRQIFKAAETVYPVNVKITRIPTPAPRYTTVDIPFLRGGMRAMHV